MRGAVGEELHVLGEDVVLGVLLEVAEQKARREGVAMTTGRHRGVLEHKLVVAVEGGEGAEQVAVKDAGALDQGPEHEVGHTGAITAYVGLATRCQEVVERAQGGPHLLDALLAALVVARLPVSEETTDELTRDRIKYLLSTSHYTNA